MEIGNIEKNQDGSYNVQLTDMRLNVLKSLITGSVEFTLSAIDAANLSTKLYTPKKKYRKPAVKKTPALKQE